MVTALPPTLGMNIPTRNMPPSGAVKQLKLRGIISMMLRSFARKSMPKASMVEMNPPASVTPTAHDMRPPGESPPRSTVRTVAREWNPDEMVDIAAASTAVRTPPPVRLAGG